MKRKLFFYALLLIIVSCRSNGSIQLSKGEKLFFDQLIEKKNSITTGKQLIFILNQSSCQPCEDKVRGFYLSDKWDGINKTFIVATNREPVSEEKENYVSFEHRDLASYGLIRANGTVVLLNDGNCILLESIDVKYLSKLEDKIAGLLGKTGN